MKKTLLGLLIATAACQAPQILLDPPPPDVVLVDTTSSNGSGFPVAFDGDATVYLTCRHVIEEHGELDDYIDADGSESLRVELHPTLDLALIWCLRPTAEVVEIRTDAPKPGEKVYTIGFLHHPTACTSNLVMSDGYVSSQGVSHTSARIFFGMSGGPLIDRGGRAVGVNGGVYLLRNGDSVMPISLNNYFVPLHQATDWLQEHGVID